MVKSPIDYSKGKIYKIWSPSTDQIYIGSTTKKYLSQRLVSHAADYTRWQQGQQHYISSFELMKYDDYRIELIENVANCASKDDLHAREGHYQRLYKDISVNKYIANRTYKEWYEDNADKVRECVRKYRNDNIEKVRERERQYARDHAEIKKEYLTGYRKEHSDAIKSKNKEYYEDNIDKIHERQKKYRGQHAEQIKARKSVQTNCDCGGSYTAGHKSRHMTTVKHQQWMKNNE